MHLVALNRVPCEILAVARQAVPCLLASRLPTIIVWRCKVSILHAFCGVPAPLDRSQHISLRNGFNLSELARLAGNTSQEPLYAFQQVPGPRSGPAAVGDPRCISQQQHSSGRIC